MIKFTGENCYFVVYEELDNPNYVEKILFNSMKKMKKVL